MSDIENRLTYVIPTHNRPLFMRRLLTFMERFQEPSRILIVDSSNHENRAGNEAVVAEFASRLRLIYQHHEKSFIQKCRLAMETVNSPFTVFCADDDFLMPDAVTSCLEFLERSDEHSCAQGIMVSLCTNKQNKCYALPVYSIEDENPLRRFRRMSSNWYSTFYSVHRTEVIRSAYQVTDDETEDTRARIFPEILLSQMSVAMGKLKYIPCVYNLREEHDLNESAVTDEIVDIDNCGELYESFRCALAQQLADSSGATLAHAKELVHEYYGYLKDGGRDFAIKKRTRRYRFKRELRRHWRKLMDAFRNDAILQRRRIHPAEPMCQNRPWQLAHRLMLDFPQGMTEDSKHKLPKAA
jgi:glycosyltransferase domain-containing protein